MQSLAQGWLVYELTGREDYLGLVGAVGTLPVLLFTLPSGVIADRFSKRRITIVTQSLLAVQALALAALVRYGLVQPWHIVVLAAFSGLVNALDVPARQAMTIELVGKEDLMNAVALSSSAFNGARIIGPSIAGLIIAAAGPAACFFWNGVSYAAVIVSLLIIRPKPLRGSDRNGSMIAQISEGLAHARKNIVIRDLLILTAAASIFALHYPTILPAMAKDVLQVDPKGLGVMMSAAGLGALLAALAVAGVGDLFRPGAIVTLGSVVAPVGIVALALVQSFPVAVACLVFTGFGMMMFLSVSNTIIQVASPDDLRGRILSLRTLVFMGLAPVGALQIGLVAQYVGVRASLAVGGGAMVLAAAYLAFVSPTVGRGRGPSGD